MGKTLKTQVFKRHFPFWKGIAEVDLKGHFYLKTQGRINKKPGNDGFDENSLKYYRKMIIGAL